MPWLHKKKELASVSFQFICERKNEITIKKYFCERINEIIRIFFNVTIFK
jgi:hypothetical protein